MNRSPMRALGGALLAVAVAGSLLVASTSSTATARTAAATPAAAAPAKPKVGSCHALSIREAAKVSDADAPVDCSKTHTSRTFLVPPVPAGVKMSDNDALSRVVDRKCGPAYDRTVTRNVRSRIQSAYTLYWFAPTKQQIRAGARWVRCDVALVGGAVLAPLPSVVRTPALKAAPHPDNEALCRLSKRQNYAATVCSRPHAFRVKGVFTLSGRQYPSRETQLRAAARRCPRITGSRQWLVDPPSETGWNNGFKFFICFKPTRA